MTHTNDGPHSRKPDPEEPWRYACPECGSVDVSHYATPTQNEPRFDCSRCYWCGRKSELEDKRG